MKKYISLLIISVIAFINVFNVNSIHAEKAVKPPTEKEVKLSFEKSYVLRWMASKWYLDTTLYTYLNSNYGDVYKLYLSYDYLNKTNSYATLIEFKKSALNMLKVKSVWQLAQMAVDNNYDISVQNKKRTLSWFPSWMTDDANFNFMIEWIKNDKTSKKYAKSIGESIGVDYKLVMAAILTEQVRYALTERGEMKKFLKGVPMLLYLTKYSYWIGWIKSFTATKIRNDAKLYWYWKELEVHNKISTESQWKSILIDKYWQIAYPSYLIKNIQTRWYKAWFNIYNNPWVVITLYNFWNIEDKKPNKSPKVWGADIFIKDKAYNFGWLWEWFYWWIKIYKPF